MKKIKAELFDIPGFLLFIILFVTGISIVQREQIAGIIVISIACLGLLADGYSLITNFILHKR
jgi:hypothetical protein